MRRVASLILLAILVLPFAAAQHEHHDAAQVVIAHDANMLGYEYVGNLAHFGVLDLGGDLVPDYHQQNHIKVTLNGATLMETTPDSGHDYDGVNMFDVTFPVAGEYSVADYNEAGQMLAMFNGTVVAQPAYTGTPAPFIALDGPDVVTPGSPATYTYSLRSDYADHGGHIMNHTDAWFEVRDSDGLQLRTKTHTHNEAMSVDYFYTGKQQSYTVRVTGFQAYPGPSAILFAPSTVEKVVKMMSGIPSAPTANPVGPTAPDAPQMNAVVQGSNTSPYTLVGTYDPWTTVGPSTQMHLTALVMDPVTHAPVPHVNFVASLREPSLGYTLFSSNTLHEYDGIWEFTAVEPVGQYVLSIDATRGNWTSHIDMPYAVVPPALAAMQSGSTIPITPTGGVELVDVQGLDNLSAGRPFMLDLAIRDSLDAPLMHSEIDYQVVSQEGTPVLAGKLHTHETGQFRLTAALPAGNYTLRLAPFALEPRPTVAFYNAACAPAFAAPGCRVDAIPFTVGPGPGFLSERGPPAKNGDPAILGAPGIDLPMLLSVVALALLARRQKSA